MHVVCMTAGAVGAQQYGVSKVVHGQLAALSNVYHLTHQRGERRPFSNRSIQSEASLAEPGAITA